MDAESAMKLGKAMDAAGTKGSLLAEGSSSSVDLQTCLGCCFHITKASEASWSYSCFSQSILLVGEGGKSKLGVLSFTCLVFSYLYSSVLSPKLGMINHDYCNPFS